MLRKLINSRLTNYTTPSTSLTECTQFVDQKFVRVRVLLVRVRGLLVRAFLMRFTNSTLLNKMRVRGLLVRALFVGCW